MKKVIALLLFVTFTFVLTACSPNEYTVSFDSDGGTAIEDQVVLEGEFVESPIDPEKEGFEFNHWFIGLESMAYDFTTEVTEELELKASWTQLEYVVSFSTTMGTVTDSQDVNHGDSATEPSNPTDPTHNFVHWYLTDDTVPFDFSSEVTTDLTLNAKWMDKELFNVTFDSAGGSAIAVQSVMEGYVATLPETPEYFGYEFVRWFTDDDTVAFDFATPITEAVTLTALWTDRPLYEVSFDSAGGSAVALQNIHEGYVATEPTAPEYHGYEFVRWFTDDDTVAFDFANPITEDTVLTALWTMKPIYEVSFDSMGGSAVALQNVIEDDMAMEPADPTQYGFEFEYWYSDDENTPFDFTTIVTTDIALTAKWTELTLYSVRFLGTDIDTQNIPEGDMADEPNDPSKIWYLFDYWYTTDENVPFDFSDPITANLYLKAKWLVDTDSTIYDEVIAYGALLTDITDTLPTPARGEVHNADLNFYSESGYISDAGVVLPMSDDEPAGTTGDWRVKFTLDGGFIYHTYQIPLSYLDDVVIADTRVVPFENLTTEYDVADSDVTLLFEAGGSVPYIKVSDFFSLVEGFIDPTIPMTFTNTADTLEIFYQYYDEDEDITYDLILTIDATENTISTNDPGFYWAYIYSTETNYGRHIEYVQDHPMESYLEGDDVIYDLDDYNLDIVMYEGEVVLPYYITNQLFAGSAYYNVYYNYDGLYGIYSLPSDGSRELTTIQASSKNYTEIPSDLSIHTFNVLAFDLNNLYGLKDIMGVTDYYDLLYYLKDDLLVKDPEDFEIGLRDLLLKELDEPHTSYGYHSYFNKSGYEGPVTNDLAVYGSRFVAWYYDGLVDTDDAIGAKWGEATSGWNVANKPDYWWVDDSTVMLSLNGFVTSDIEESAVYDELITEDMMEVSDLSTILPSVAQGNKFFYYNNSTETNNIVELLVKGVDASYVDTYEAALIALGFTHVTDTTTDPLKQDGYYTMSVTEGEVTTDYMVVVGYDAVYDVFYVGITDSVTISYSGTWLVYADVYALIEADSAVYMEFMLQEIEEEQPLFTTILLDLSWNTGGNVGALYRVLGFITDNPFMVTGIDGDTNGASTSYVSIGDIPDYSDKTWFLITTPTSFSAANSMANIFKANDLGEVIGVQTGGGACSITPILLPNGTAFTMSSNNISAYRTGTGTEEDPYVYHNVEFGIAPDHAISIEDIYNEAILLGIINS